MAKPTRVCWNCACCAGTTRVDDDVEVVRCWPKCMRGGGTLGLWRPVGFVTRDLLNNAFKTRLAHYSKRARYG